MIKRGELQAFKVGNKMRIEEKELERYKKSFKTPVKKELAAPSGPPTDAQPIQLAGSHDFLVELFVKQASAVIHKQIQPIFIGSLEGLMMLYRNQCDIAAIHLLDPATHEYNLPVIKRLFIYEPITIVRFAAREQGFIVAKGNPKKINHFSDLTRKDIQFVNRQKGSGTRFLLDYKLAEANIDPKKINGYETEEWSHLSTASYISRGAADVALGIRSAASHLGLDFLPIVKENFDLVFRFNDKNRKYLQSLIRYLQSSEFKSSITDLEGYDISDLGNILYQK